MTVIAHNITAMNTQRQYGINTDLKAKTAEKLASGYRINRAADDAAGLAISEKMRSQIRGLTKGVQNTEDGVSLCHVADGALNEVSAMLHRMKELSVQSANGTNTDEDRDNLQDEVEQLLEEIDRIGSDTEFNTMPIFEGQTEKTVIPATYAPILANNFSVTGTPTDTVSTKYIISANENGFSINNASFTWDEMADNNGNTLASNPLVGSTYQMQFNGMTLSVDVEEDADISDVVNLLDGASFSTKVTKGQMVDRVQIASVTGRYNNAGDSSNGVFKITCNGKYITLETNVAVQTPSITLDMDIRNIVENGIVKEGSYTLSFGESASMLDDCNVTIDFNVLEDMTLDEFNSIFHNAELSHTFNAKFDDCVGKGEFSKTSPDDLYIRLSRERMQSLGVAFNDGKSINTVFKIDDNGNKTILLDDGTVLYQTHQSYPELYESADGTALVSYPYEITDTMWKNIQNVDSGYLFSTNPFDDGYPIITGITLNSTGQLEVGGTVVVDGFVDSGYKGNIIENEQVIYSEEALKLWIQSGANEGQGMWLEIDEMNTSILGLADMNISTAEGATKALGQVRQALAKVSKNRSKIGAQQNRLEHTIDRENVAIENLTASESGIRDADMAQEMVSLSKYNILEQAGQAMMAQANQSKQGVLQLLSFS